MRSRTAARSTGSARSRSQPERQLRAASHAVAYDEVAEKAEASLDARTGPPLPGIADRAAARGRHPGLLRRLHLPAGRRPARTWRPDGEHPDARRPDPAAGLPGGGAMRARRPNRTPWPAPTPWTPSAGTDRARFERHLARCEQCAGKSAGCGRPPPGWPPPRPRTTSRADRPRPGRRRTDPPAPPAHPPDATVASPARAMTGRVPPGPGRGSGGPGGWRSPQPPPLVAAAIRSGRPRRTAPGAASSSSTVTRSRRSWPPRMRPCSTPG